MEQVRQSIDDRNRSISCQFLNRFMRIGADHDAVDKTGKDAGRVLDGLAAANLACGLTHIDWMTTQLMEPRFKGNPGSCGRLGKNHGKGLPFQVFMRFAHFLFFLQLAAHIKDGCHFPNTQIMDGNQIFIF